MDRRRQQANNPLAVVGILEPLSEEELLEFAARSPDIYLQGRQDFYGESEHRGGLFLIKSGRVQVYRLSLRGNQLTLLVLSTGSVLPGRRMRGLYAQAIETSVITFVRRSDVERLVRTRPEVGLRLVDLLTDDLHSMDEFLFDVVHKDVLSRLAGLILRLLHSEGVVDREGLAIPAGYTHAQLGTMIGARRVAVTRAFNRLREAGMVEITRGRIRIDDAEALEQTAAAEK